MADGLLPNALGALSNRANSVDDQVDSAMRPSNAAVPAPQPPSATRVMPVSQGTHNPDNNLPDNEGVFHKIFRRFSGGPVGS